MNTKTIGECFSYIKNGANIKQGVLDGGYPITRIETIADDQFNRNRMGYAGITNLKQYESYILEDCDLLMSHINSVQYLGRTVLYRKENNETILHGMNLLRLKPVRTLIDPSYARYFFYSRFFREQIGRITKKSVNQASFSISDLKNIKILTPSLEKQKRIAETFDKVVETKKLQEQIKKKFDDLIKARFVEMFGDPDKNPLGWEKVRISTVLCGKASNGYFAKRDEYTTDGNAAVLGVAYVVNRMYSQVNDLPRTNASEKDIKKYSIKYGDILFCRSSLVAEGIGKASIVPENTPYNTLFECHVIRLQLDLEKCIPEFIQVLSTTDYFRNQVIAQSKTATMTTIGQDGILKTVIVLPPIEKQREFYSFIKQIDKSKVIVQKSLEQTQLLFDSLMQQYFG